MNRLTILRMHKRNRFGTCAVFGLCTLLMFSSIGAPAQSTAPSANAAFSIRATHLMGFPNTKNNCNGTLSISGEKLRFDRDAKGAAEVKIASVEGVFLGSESKQVGGTPVKLGKAAAPFGSGRVFSLFAHKNYDTLTLEYVDDDGGVHGAIFQLNKGQAELVRKEIVGRAVPLRLRDDDAPENSIAGASHENK